jgi:hypothetical protein
MKATHFSVYKSKPRRLQNKLEEEVYQYIKGIDRYTFEIKHIGYFIEEVKYRINEINKKYPLCNPIKVTIDLPYNENADIDLILTNRGLRAICNLTLLCCLVITIPIPIPKKNKHTMSSNSIDRPF